MYSMHLLKATGMHPNKILKSVKEIIANSLSDVFNASIQSNWNASE